jgi:hypothetical protein
MLQAFNDGYRERFFHYWHEHVSIELIERDISLKTLEFLLYTHFAIYYYRSKRVRTNRSIFEFIAVFRCVESRTSQ